MAAVAATVALEGGASAQCTYEFIPIPVEICAEGGIPFTPQWNALGINEVDGEIVVVGEVDICIDAPGVLEQPFWWTTVKGTSRIDVPDGGDGRANDINANGDIVGFLAGFGHRPFIHAGGVSQVLPMPTGANVGEAYAINDDGMIVGYAEREAPLDGYTPCWWDEDRQFHAIPIDELYGVAYGVNPSGVVVGYISNSSVSNGASAFIWSEESMEIVPLEPSAVSAIARHVSDRDDVIGGMYLQEDEDGIKPLHLFRYRKGQLTWLQRWPTYRASLVDAASPQGLVCAGRLAHGDGPNLAALWHDTSSIS